MLGTTVEKKTEAFKIICVFYYFGGKDRAHFFHKPLAEGWSDPFSGVNPTVHPNDLFGFIWWLTDLRV